MKPHQIWLGLLLLLAGSGQRVAGDVQNARVISVGDGDTIRVRHAGRTITVRLACIDAPETSQHPYGQESRRHLQRWVPVGREIVLNIKTTDRYGRTVAEVHANTNINLAMVEAGQAFVYRRYLSGCRRMEYINAENRAGRRRLGIWQVKGGITRPWNVRRARYSSLFPD